MRQIRFVVHVSDLRDEEWIFDVADDYIVLDRWIVRLRATKRHKFCPDFDVSYARSAYNPGSRNENIVPITPEIRDRALDEYVQSLRVVTLSELERIRTATK